MQVKNYDGSYGLPEKFDSDKLKERLLDPKVEKVEVFNGTEEELARRSTPSFLGVKKKFQKTGNNKK
jgi:hypothetical protein